jgi:hypothetical protein
MEMQMQKIHFQNKNVWNNLERKLFPIYSVYIWNIKCFEICHNKKSKWNMINKCSWCSKKCIKYVLRILWKKRKKRTSWIALILLNKALYGKEHWRLMVT